MHLGIRACFCCPSARISVCRRVRLSRVVALSPFHCSPLCLPIQYNPTPCAGHCLKAARDAGHAVEDDGLLFVRNAQRFTLFARARAPVGKVERLDVCTPQRRLLWEGGYMGGVHGLVGTRAGAGIEHAQRLSTLDPSLSAAQTRAFRSAGVRPQSSSERNRLRMRRPAANSSKDASTAPVGGRRQLRNA